MMFTKFITVFLISVMCIIAVLFSVMLIRGQMRHDKIMEELTARKISGRIIGIKKGSRGGAYLNFNDNFSNSELKYYLTIVYFIEKHEIVVGDLVSKDAGSDTLIFGKIIDKDTLVFKYRL